MEQIPATFTSSGAELVGTFATPSGSGPFPTALLIPGSGEHDRDANHKRMSLNLSKDLAEILADAGWASLRYDKRGVGASEGTYLSTGFLDEFEDVTAAYRWLKGRLDVSTVVAVGHSAGALHAAELASRQPDLAGAILLATSTKTGGETLSWQTAKIQEHAVPAIAKSLLKLFGTSVAKQQAKAAKRIEDSTTDVARIQLVKVNAKWMREFMAYDPVPALRRSGVPILAITGSKDIQVDPNDLLTVAEVAPDTAVTELVEDVDHLLRHEPADFSNPKKYKKQITKPIDERVRVAIVSWLHGLPTANSTTPPEDSHA